MAQRLDERDTTMFAKWSVPSRHRLGGLGALVSLLLVVSGLVLVATVPPSAAAADPCAPGGNPIVCENSKPGTPESQWDINGPGDDDIQGFSTDISVDVGHTIDFKIDTDASAYTITIFRTGWYGGDGARKIDSVTPDVSLPQHQPDCIWDVTTELTDCGNWAVSAHWDVPSDAVSGVYIALLKRTDNGDASHITFVVRNDDSHSDIIYQTSDPTWEAYNTYGGSDFYQGAANGRAYKVSYNRPTMTRNSPGGQDFYFANEYPLVRFLERNGYDVSYMSGVDTDRYGGLIKNHKVFLSVGHDEYWSGAQRANVEAARDAGVNLQFLSGNEVYWRTRYEPSADSSHTAYRTLVTYKEAWAQAKIDPSAESTSTWRDPRYAPKSEGGGLPENSLTGTIFMANYADLPVTVTKAEGKLRLWAHTGLDQMTGASTALAPHTVGYEADEDQDNGARPPGLIDLSTTTGDIAGQYMTDYGLTTGDGTLHHSLTLYRAPSGALVFGAGSVQWTWGLDDDHDTAYAYEPADPRMQQAEINLLADMGAQPATLMSGMVAATKSTDTTGPTVTIASPAAGAAVGNGSQVTVTGTATDTGGGQVAGVEYSTDGGSSWHPATGTSSWTFTYTQHGVGNTPLEVRAVDDSANIGAAVSRTFAVSCPCSVFGNSAVPTRWTSETSPATTASDDPSAVELGLRFTPAADGYVTGVRFYKGAGNTGTHVGSLWDTSGQRLASVTFANESASGWQQATFATPVAVTAGSTYVVSYTDPAGHYAVQPWAFGEAGIDADPLQVDGGYGADMAGVYGNSGQFPELTSQDANYYVDPLFTTTDESPLIATNQWPAADSASVATSTTISAKLSKPVDAASVKATVKDANGATVAGATSYDSSTRTVTFTPSAALAGFVTYTVTLAATDSQGDQLTTGKTWSFTTAKPQGAPGVCPCSLFSDGTVPTTVEVADPNQVTLGVRFSADVDGTVTAVRFYKGAHNTGTHTGTLWTADGTKLAEGTFTGEPSSGWATLTFSQPVSITKNTTYVASYRTDVGEYSVTPNGFAAADLSYGPLHVSTTAGAYAYGTGFPSNATANNYLVDVVFQKATPTLAVASESPADGSVDIPRAAPVSLSLTAPIASGYAMTLTSGGSAVPGSVALDSAGTTLTFTPSGLMPADNDVKVTVSGLVSTDGVTLPTQTWTFHTRGPDSATAQSLFTNQLPATPAADDSAAVEVGTRFVPAKDGSITGIRFFKGTGNGGTHTGHLWTADGRLLATVTFNGESASGWQQATVSPAVPVTAGTAYVVSYLAPQGHYASTPSFFGSAFTSGDLSAPADASESHNGVYLYGAAGGFPTFSYNATNYFADIVFEPAPTSISASSHAPASGATGVNRDASPSITFSAKLAAGYTMTAKQGTTTISGAVTVSGDGRTLSFTPTGLLPADADVTVTVSGISSVDGATLADQSWTFHTEAAATGTSSIFGSATPATPAADDASTVEIGTAFTPSKAGTITKVRFYKGAGNTGPHTATIWSSTGASLATASFGDETATGWQQATLTTPLSVSAGATYVVSYAATQGHYSYTSGFFDSAVTSGGLTAPAGGGRYRYPGSTAFSSSSAGYLVDVVYSPAATTTGARDGSTTDSAADTTPSNPSPRLRTSVALSAPSTASYGQSVAVTMRVSPAATGSARVAVGTHALATGVRQGRASVMLPLLTAGRSYRISGSFAPTNATTAMSSSASRTVRIVRDRTTTRAAVVKVGKHLLRVRATVGSRHGLTPTGRVVVRLAYAGHRVHQKTAALRHGAARLRLSVPRRGLYRLVVTYRASIDFAGSRITHPVVERA